MTQESKSLQKPDMLGFLFLRKNIHGRNKKYASFNRRILAATIDSLFLLFAAPFFNHVAPVDRSVFRNYPMNSNDLAPLQQWMIHTLTNPAFVSSWLANLFVQIIAIWILSGICWHYWSATPGKILLRIKVVDADTEAHITNKQIIIRLLGYVVSAAPLLIGFFWINFDKRHQAWHDKLANTVVVVIPWKWKKASA